MTSTIPHDHEILPVAQTHNKKHSDPRYKRADLVGLKSTAINKSQISYCTRQTNKSNYQAICWNTKQTCSAANAEILLCCAAKKAWKLTLQTNIDTLEMPNMIKREAKTTFKQMRNMWNWNKIKQLLPSAKHLQMCSNIQWNTLNIRHTSWSHDIINRLIIKWPSWTLAYIEY